LDAALWTPIYNTAQIYFDLNPAVVTATTVNTLTEDPMPAASFTVNAANPANPVARDFTYTGATPGVDLQWDFGSGSLPATAIGPNPSGVVFPPGVQRVILRASLGDCTAEPAVQVFTVGSGAVQSRVRPLSAAQDLPDFTVEWDDWESEMPAQNYTIYVSEDGGPFSEFQSHTAEVSAGFSGRRGHTYSFYSRATDSFGQVEDAPTTADTSTTVRTRLEVNRSPTSLVITWDGPGQLQTATEVSGPWESVSNATSPYPVLSTYAQRFFRVIQ
jgi:hypothetical protein